jgi:hypothetical protein
LKFGGIFVEFRLKVTAMIIALKTLQQTVDDSEAWIPWQLSVLSEQFRDREVNHKRVPFYLADRRSAMLLII